MYNDRKQNNSKSVNMKDYVSDSVEIASPYKNTNFKRSNQKVFIENLNVNKIIVNFNFNPMIEKVQKLSCYFYWFYDNHFVLLLFPFFPFSHLVCLPCLLFSFL